MNLQVPHASAPGRAAVPPGDDATAPPRAWRDLAAFGLITLVLSWVPWICLDRLHVGFGGGTGFVVFGLAAAGPSLAALVMRLAGRRRPAVARTRASWVWPVAALVLGAAPPLVAAAWVHAGDLAVLPAHAAATIAGVGGPLGALAYTMVSGPLSEEFGWRGFVQPRLRSRVGRLRATVLLGVCWGVWHVPLFFMAGTGQHAMGIASVPGVLFFVGLVPLSGTILFLSERLRGGVWAAIIVHAAWNLSAALMPDPGTVGSVIETAVLVAIAGGTGIAWRALDRRSTGDSVPARR